jgi:hypothetical protein
MQEAKKFGPLCHTIKMADSEYLKKLVDAQEAVPCDKEGGSYFKVLIICVLI